MDSEAESDVALALASKNLNAVRSKPQEGLGRWAKDRPDEQERTTSKVVVEAVAAMAWCTVRKVNQNHVLRPVWVPEASGR
eukprot:13491328-Alexandrium_andersonii.AAC.1